MGRLENALYSTKQIHSCEQKAIHELNISEDELMARAGASALYYLKARYDRVQNIAIFCGSGKNAGDGYILAALAHKAGFSVSIYQAKPPSELPPAVQKAAQNAVSAGIACHCIEDTIDPEVQLIVDALLGIGIQGDVREPIAHAINLINESGLPVIALDIPSGLNADTGKTLGVCVKASMTITFVAPKIGLYTSDGPDYAGEIVLAGLQIERCLNSISPSVYRIEENLCRQVLVPRKKNSFKSMYGHVLILGGAPGMVGSVFLAAHAALRVGAGLVTIATWPDHALAGLNVVPEVMVHGVKSTQELDLLLEKATVAVIGPGLGVDEWGRKLFHASLAAQLPLVLDASALRLLSQNPQYDDNWILTPHPGEAASLLEITSKDVQANRLLAVKQIQEKYGGAIVLKGAGSLIQTQEDETYICTAGNPGMASAGMGDVLSGVIGGLLAQGLSMNEAAKLGVLLHAQAGDQVAKLTGERGMTASDLMPRIYEQINHFV